MHRASLPAHRHQYTPKNVILLSYCLFGLHLRGERGDTGGKAWARVRPAGVSMGAMNTSRALRRAVWYTALCTHEAETPQFPGRQAPRLALGEHGLPRERAGGRAGDRTAAPWRTRTGHGEARWKWVACQIWQSSAGLGCGAPSPSHAWPRP
jgi:hypothetical protein